MNPITLTFDKQVLADLRTALCIRGMSGQSNGILEAFLVKLLEKIEAEEARWHVQRKTKRDDG